MGRCIGEARHGEIKKRGEAWGDLERRRGIGSV